MKKVLATTGVAALIGVGLIAAPASASSEMECKPSDGMYEEVIKSPSSTETTEWRTSAPEGDGWEVIDTRTVVITPGEEITEYLASYYEETDWVTESPGDLWEEIDEREVVTQEHSPGHYEKTGWLLAPPDGEGDWVLVAKRWVWDTEPSTIDHPAVGDPQIEVPNPDYVKAHWKTIVIKEAWVEEVVESVLVQEAWTEPGKFDHWQRYSWNGSAYPGTQAPPFPHPNWQANTKSDPHGVGKEGAYYRSKGKSGKGDWFYLEAVYGDPVHHPAVYKDVVSYIDHPAKTKKVYVPESGSPTIVIDNPDYRGPWTEKVPGEGHKEFKYEWSTPEVPEVSHKEFRFAKYTAPEWVTEVPEGWTVEDERTVTVVEEVTQEEFRYERAVPEVRESTFVPGTVECSEVTLPLTPKAATSLSKQESLPQQASAEELPATGAGVGMAGLSAALLVLGAGAALVSRRSA